MALVPKRRLVNAPVVGVDGSSTAQPIQIGTRLEIQPIPYFADDSGIIIGTANTLPVFAVWTGAEWKYADSLTSRYTQDNVWLATSNLYTYTLTFHFVAGTSAGPYQYLIAESTLSDYDLRFAVPTNFTTDVKAYESVSWDVLSTKVDALQTSVNALDPAHLSSVTPESISAVNANRVAAPQVASVYGVAPLDTTSHIPASFLPIAPSSYGAAPLVHTHQAVDVTGGIFTIALLPVPTTAASAASATQVVRGDDPRLIDSRVPLTHVHDGSAITTGVVPPARLGTGVRDGTKYLRDDGAWTAAVGGGGGMVAASQADVNAGTRADVAVTPLTLQKGAVNGVATLDASGILPTAQLTVHTHLKAAITDFAHVHAASDVTSGVFALALFPVAATGVSDAGKLTRSDDSRLSDARTPLTHVHDAAAVTTGTLALAVLPTAGVAASATSTQLVRGDDPRMTDVRTPAIHTHAASDIVSGNFAITVLPVAASGVSDITKLVRSDDVRLGDARAPLTHTHVASDITGGTFSLTVLPVAASGVSDVTKLTRSDDSRLSDSRTPLAHVHDAAVITTGVFGLAVLPVAASGVVSLTALVRADDARLSDSRTPLTHTHLKAQITDFAHTHPWSDLTAVPATFAPSAHVHDAAAITTGVLALAILPVALSGVSNTTSLVRADDSRLSDSRVPLAHTQLKASITDFTHTHVAADVTSGVFALALFPVAATGVVSATTLVRADDSRLSDSRVPLTHVHSGADITSGAVAPVRLGTGTTDATTVLYGDGTWKPAGGAASTGANESASVTTPATNSRVETFPTNGALVTPWVFDSGSANLSVVANVATFSGYAMVNRSDSVWLNGQVKAVVKNGSGVVWRYTDGSNHWKISGNATTYYLLLRKTGVNAGADLVVTSWVYTQDTAYTLRVASNGSAISIYWNDGTGEVLKASTTDTYFPTTSGKAGILGNTITGPKSGTVSYFEALSWDTNVTVSGAPAGYTTRALTGATDLTSVTGTNVSLALHELTTVDFLTSVGAVAYSVLNVKPGDVITYSYVAYSLGASVAPFLHTVEDTLAVATDNQTAYTGLTYAPSTRVIAWVLYGGAPYGPKWFVHSGTNLTISFAPVIAGDSLTVVYRA